MENYQVQPMSPTHMSAPPYPYPVFPAVVDAPYPAQPAFQPAYQPAVEPVQQQPAYQYVSQQQTVTTVMTTPQTPVDDHPTPMVCPRCQNSVTTKVNYKNGFLTWLICILLGFFICWPCCWIPFVVNSCKDAEHSCPMCNHLIHVYKRR